MGFLFLLLLILLLVLFVANPLWAVVLAILGLIANTGLFIYRQFLRLPIGHLAPARPSIDCSFPSGPLPDDTAPDIVIAPNETRSEIRGKTIQMPVALTIAPPSNFTLIAFGDITIDGRIVPASGGSITLASVNGTITIGSTAIIGPVPASIRPLATGGSGRYTQALGTPGTTTGFIKMIALSVVIEGVVRGEPGGPGGAASARGVGFGPFGGLAVAAGGQGGFGGTILVCAVESIDIIAQVVLRAGDGGDGGSATARADQGDEGIAYGGPGNSSGDVLFVGTGSGRCQVNFRPAGAFAPKVTAGNGGAGGEAVANGGAGRTDQNVVLALAVGDGGRGVARGGRGGNAGTVRFTNCDVSPFAPVTAGSGGVGNAALATGGGGAPALRLAGYEGGAADSQGGNGGLTGEATAFPLIGGGSSAVALPANPGGSGGSAMVVAGRGGAGGGGVFGFGGGGGPSGRADALGGSNPNTGATATMQSANPVPGGAGPRGAGGIGPRITSPGAP